MKRIDFIASVNNVLRSDIEPVLPGTPGTPDAVRISHAGKCSRLLWFGMNVNGEDTSRQSTSVVMEMGTLIHAVLQREIPKMMEAEVEVTVDFRPTFPVVGHADVVLDDVVIDYKTCSGNVFSARSNKGPEQNNLLQVMLYAYGLGKANAGLVYIDRGTLKMVYFETKVQEEPVLYELNRLTQLYNNAGKDVVPPRFAPMYGILDPFKSYPCRYCPMANICVEMGE